MSFKMLPVTNGREANVRDTLRQPLNLHQGVTGLAGVNLGARGWWIAAVNASLARKPARRTAIHAQRILPAVDGLILRSTAENRAISVLVLVPTQLFRIC
eukprot:Lankesteria_metandrocarpae@DN9018_c0_g1_i1.p1